MKGDGEGLGGLLWFVFMVLFFVVRWYWFGGTGKDKAEDPQVVAARLKEAQEAQRQALERAKYSKEVRQNILCRHNLPFLLNGFTYTFTFTNDSNYNLKEVNLKLRVYSSDKKVFLKEVYWARWPSKATRDVDFGGFESDSYEKLEIEGTARIPWSDAPDNPIDLSGVWLLH